MLSAAQRDQKLIVLGENVLRAAIYRKEEAARNRRILRTVHTHINASAEELKERLEDEMKNTPLITKEEEDKILSRLVR